MAFDCTCTKYYFFEFFTAPAQWASDFRRVRSKINVILL